MKKIDIQTREQPMLAHSARVLKANIGKKRTYLRKKFSFPISQNGAKYQVEDYVFP